MPRAKQISRKFATVSNESLLLRTRLQMLWEKQTIGCPAKGSVSLYETV